MPGLGYERLPKLSEFWESGEFSDFTIKCGPYELKVHKVIISAGCKFFKAACSSNAFREGETATITMASDQDDPSCDDPDAVRSMVSWLYLQDYEVEKLDFPPTQSCFPMTDDGNAHAHAKVFAAAVKYDIPSLRRASVDKFRGALWANSEHASVADAITTVFTTTQEEVRQLRDIVSEFLVDSKTLLRREDIEAAVNNIQGLTADLVHRLQTTLEAEKRKEWDVKCISCEHTDDGDFVCPQCDLVGGVRAYDPSDN